MSESASTNGLFAGTAEYYARFRPAYPPELLSFMRERMPAHPRRRLLDLGCGTGELAIPLSHQMAEVDAVDVDPEMVRLGKAKAAQAGCSNIRWSVGRAEDVVMPVGHYDLVTAGASFHWMESQLVAAHTFSALRPGGSMAVTGANSVWNGDEEWQRVVVEVIRGWLGEQRRAGEGVFVQPQAAHDEVLRAAGFVDVIELTFPAHQSWDLDSFIGYLRSSSFASPEVLGDRAEGFERDLRAALLEVDPSGVYTETLRFRCLVGSKLGS